MCDQHTRDASRPGDHDHGRHSHTEAAQGIPADEHDADSRVHPEVLDTWPGPVVGSADTSR